VTIKEAQGVARKFLGSRGVAVLVQRAEKPCKLAVQGPVSLDLRGEGNTWEEAKASLQAREQRAESERQFRLKWARENSPRRKIA
jgi:hypothetical protein